MHAADPTTQATLDGVFLEDDDEDTLCFQWMSAVFPVSIRELIRRRGDRAHQGGDARSISPTNAPEEADPGEEEEDHEEGAGPKDDQQQGARSQVIDDRAPPTGR